MNSVPVGDDLRARLRVEDRTLLVARHRLEPHLEDVALEGGHQGRGVNHPVAQRGHPSVRRRDDPPDHRGQVDHRPCVLAPFDVVGVQQRVLGLAGHHRRQLPAEVGGVADAAVVALALPHRHQVGGVTGDHQAPLPERARDARVVGVDPVPDDVDALRVRNHLGEHASDERRAVGLFVGLVAVDHELEPPNAVRDRDRHVGPRWDPRRLRCSGVPVGRSRNRRPASASGRWCRRTTPPSAAGWRCGRRRSRRRSGRATGSRPSANSTVTPSAVSVQFSIRWPHRTSTLSKRSRPASSSASTMGWTKPLRLGHPKRASGGAISASSFRFASKNRRIWLGTVCGRTCSTRPIDWNVRSASSSSPTPRG